MVVLMTRNCWFKVTEDWSPYPIHVTFKVEATSYGLKVMAFIPSTHNSWSRHSFQVGSDVVASITREVLGSGRGEISLGDSFVEDYEQTLAKMHRRRALAPHVMMTILSLMPVEDHRVVVRSTGDVFLIEPKDVLQTARHSGRGEVADSLREMLDW